jgi:large subunit ribosomal protein L4
MTTLQVRTQDGGTAGTVDLDDDLFGIEPNEAVLHQVITAQLAAGRRGTHSTKTRAEVRGGGAKPWRQKGTGRARQGSIRAPQWTGGGVAHGPKPRSYRQKVNKKMVRLALRSALSDRARSERIVVVDRWVFDTPRTKDALSALAALELDGRVLMVLDRGTDMNAALSFRNLAAVDTVERGELNAYDIVRSDWLVFTSATLPTSQAPAAEEEPEAEEPEVEDGTVADEAPEVEEPAAEEEPEAEEPEVEDGTVSAGGEEES